MHPPFWVRDPLERAQLRHLAGTLHVTCPRREMGLQKWKIGAPEGMDRCPEHQGFQKGTEQLSPRDAKMGLVGGLVMPTMD